MSFGFFILFPLLLLVVIIIFIRARYGPKSKRAFVVLLGDIGRSPRMQFHTLSLARAGYEVCVFGYQGSEPYQAVTDNKDIRLIYLSPFPAFLCWLPRLIVFVLKVVWQTIILSFALVFGPKPSHILLQNPPSLPTIAVCWFVSLVRSCLFIIDWHNYGYTILALELHAGHPLVAIHRWYERMFGRLSNSNICVTDAMREDLLNNWKIKAVTMHDRPPPMFTDLSLAKRHSLFLKLDFFRVDTSPVRHNASELTLMTLKDLNKRVKYRDDRPALLISSTSWTEDEDFSLLLNALDVYDREASSSANLPSVVCVITGKGPQKERYIKEINTRSWMRVKVFTPWLEAADYPRLVACADLGVCLHKSSSGLDLPMKVVDMFGCRLPVCAVNFRCLSELVEHDRNGIVFNTDSELAEQLQELLRGFPNKCVRLQRYRDNLKTFQQLRWDDVWAETVRPLFI